MIKTFLLFSQNIQYQEFNSNHGFVNDYIYDIEQDSIGNVWVSNSKGLSKFDNKNILTYTSKNSTDNVIYDALLNKDGMWVCGKKGFFGKLEKDHLKKISTRYTQKIVKLHAVSEHKILLVAQDVGFSLFNTYTQKIELNINYGSFGIDNVSDIIYSNNNFFVCSQMGLYVLGISKNNKVFLKHKIENLGGINHVSFYKDKIFIGTTDQGVLFFENQDMKTAKKLLLSNFTFSTPIRHLMFDSRQHLWISTFGQGIIEVDYANKNSPNYLFNHKTSNKVDINFVNKTFEDYQGNVWFCTYGTGLLYKTNDFFKLISLNKSNQLLIKDITQFNNEITVATENQLFTLDSKDSLQILTTLEKKKGTISCLAKTEAGVYIGTTENGVYYFDFKTKKINAIFYNNQSLSLKVNHLLYQNNMLWVSTYNGLFKYNIHLKSSIHFNTSNGLRHNLVNVCVALKSGEVAVGTKNNRIFYIQNDKITEYKLPSSDPSVSISDMVELKGNLYIGTLGDGLFIKTKVGVKSLTTANGLLSNIIYSVETFNDSVVIINHQDNLSLLNVTTNRINKLEKSFGVINHFQLRSSLKANSTVFLFGSDHGIIKIEPRVYLNKKILSRFGVKAIKINDSIFDIHKKSIDLDYGRYKLEFFYKGVSFNASDNTQFKYLLEGYDTDWRDGNNSEKAIYKDLGPGKYVFKVKACIDGLCEERKAAFKINIDTPLWSKLWFIILFAFVFLSITSFLFLVQQKSNARKKIMLESLIAKKTIELNNKNESILSSIAYAKRIQDAVIPDLNAVTFNFIEHFSIEMPKDIVGGDFVWFYDNGEGRIYVALCDCTGHGVPGGFMTILSQSFLNSIVQKYNRIATNLLLDYLHEAIVHQLHKNQSTKISDGLDVSLLCFDLNTQLISYSGAGRPLVYFDRNNQLNLVKGTRKSIGDAYRKENFNIHEIAFENVKSLYMFTDGITDQFGGNKIEKFGTNKLKETLELTAIKQTANEQKIFLQTTIDKWKKTSDIQTDDISIVGILLTQNIHKNT